MNTAEPSRLPERTTLQENRRQTVCLTPDDCFAAGWDDGAGDRMPASLIDRMVALHSPYLLPGESDRAA